MIDTKEFEKIRGLLEKDEKIREDMIHRSRMLIQASKKLIYSLHRDGKDAENLYDALGRKKKELEDSVKGCSEHLKLSMYSIGMQEYAEAACYYSYLKDKKLLSHSELGIGYEDYLLGLCDLTGELGRKAVFSTIAGDYDAVRDIRNMVDGIYKEFLQINLRNSELRKKSDSIKWNLKKIDEIMYDLKIKDKI